MVGCSSTYAYYDIWRAEQINYPVLSIVSTNCNFDSMGSDRTIAGVSVKKLLPENIQLAVSCLFCYI